MTEYNGSRVFNNQLSFFTLKKKIFEMKRRLAKTAQETKETDMV